MRNPFDEISQRLQDLLPPEGAAVMDDLKKQLQTMLHARLKEMDLVTREEFEVQQAVLQKTRKMVELMQERIDQLEQDLANRT